jgi:hypothetical protein
MGSMTRSTAVNELIEQAPNQDDVQLSIVGIVRAAGTMTEPRRSMRQPAH